MNWLGEFLRQLRFRKQSERFDADMAEEMRLHLDLRTADKQAQGLSAEDARAAARRQFGNAAQQIERSREAWGWTFLDRLGQDVRYGLRALRSNLSVTIAAVLSLGLGIGMNTAIFSLIHAVMLRSLPVENPEQLVELTIGPQIDELTNPMWEQLRDRQTAFSGALAFAPDRFNLTGGGESRFASGMWVSGDFFNVLGVPALLGRTLTPADDRHGGGASGPVAVISYAFWKRNFGGEPDVIGKTVRLNRHPFEIVGVTQPWFKGLNNDRRYDIAAPIGAQSLMNPVHNPLGSNDVWWLHIMGRIPAGKSLKQASDEIRSMTPEILRATMPPGENDERQKEYLKTEFSLKPLEKGFSETGDRYRVALITLMVTSGLVLLIGCANIASLLLARAAARQREIVVRMAMGASRSRVIRQLMTESLLLALCGAAAGLLFAFWCGPLLVRLISTSGRPLDVNLSPNGTVLVFAIGVGILTGFLFGLVPAISATRLGLNQVLKENIRSILPGAGRLHLRETLIAGQIALSLVLLVASALFLGTLRNLLSVDPGFSKQNVLLASVDASQTSGKHPQLFHNLLERFRDLPGVTSASASMRMPITQAGWAEQALPDGKETKSRRDSIVFLDAVSPGYFATLRSPLLAGRDFTSSDTAASQPVVIVGELTAREFFGSTNPLGRTIGLHTREDGKPVLYQVAGVVKDFKYSSLNEPKRRTAYVPFEQLTDPLQSAVFEVHFDGPNQPLTSAIRGELRQIDPALSVEFTNLETQVDESMAQPRMVALLSSAFGLLALALAAVGLYGVTTFATAQRKAEIGIRMALGASRDSVLWLVLRNQVVMLVIGLSAGLFVTLVSGRWIATLLYGMKPTDPWHVAAGVAVLSLAALLAAYVPAKKATRLDPMVALREE